MKNATCAAIDVGSNSVRLMVARCENEKLDVLHTDRITTRLMNGVVNGELSGEAFENTARAVAAHAETARQLGADLIHAFGTSALRDAKNSSAFSDRTEQLCGLRVRIISGVEEAQLAFAGAAPKGRCGVIDIGGGSTELIVGEDGQMLRAHSAQLGAVRLMNELNGRQDPEEMVETAAAKLQKTIETVCSGSAPDKWIGVGGTITTLAAMSKKVSKYTPNAIQDYPLTEELVGKWLKSLIEMPVGERRFLIGLTPNRADIIPYGAAILLAVMKGAKADPVHACDHDNLEGYIRKNMLPELHA